MDRPVRDHLPSAMSTERARSSGRFEGPAGRPAAAVACQIGLVAAPRAHARRTRGAHPWAGAVRHQLLELSRTAGGRHGERSRPAGRGGGRRRLHAELGPDAARQPRATSRSAASQRSPRRRSQAIVDYVESLAPGGPPIPSVNPAAGSLSDGREPSTWTTAPPATGRARPATRSAEAASLPSLSAPSATTDRRGHPDRARRRCRCFNERNLIAAMTSIRWRAT